MDTSAPTLLQPSEEPVVYLARRLQLYERLVRERLLDEMPNGPDLGELAESIVAFERQAEAQHHILPIHFIRARTGIEGVAEDILLLAAGIEIDSPLAALIARYYGHPDQGYVSVGLCQALFGGDRESRLRIARLLRPGGLLLDCGLMRLVPRDNIRLERGTYQLTPAPFLPPFLLGDACDPEPLHDIAETINPAVSLQDISLPEPVRARLVRLTRLPGLPGSSFEGRGGPGGFDVPPGVSILLTGPPGSGRRLAVTALAQERGHRLVRVHSDRLALQTLASAASALDLVVHYAWFFDHWLLFEDCDRLFGREGDGARAGYSALLESLLQTTAVTTFFTAEAADRLSEGIRQLLLGAVAIPSPDRRRLQDICALNAPEDQKERSPANFSRLVEKRVLSGVTIRNAMSVAARLGRLPDAAADPLAEMEWAAEGLEAASLGTLATRTFEKRTLADLILPQERRSEIESIINTVAVRRRVQRDWGFERLSSRGLGLSCLFYGESGTGKTLAAEVIANTVGLPLYQVNMAEVVSKYVGETSKNLKRVFAEAAKSQCVLLFDEADAMFSRRTEVKKSTDRYSNMEINLLLQLMESYDGITICTTNLKKGIDTAFERRFSSVVYFPEPDAKLRLAIWRHHLPPEAPLGEDLEEELPLLAEEYELSGGSIRSVVLRAAYQAAMDGSPISEQHLRESIRQEYRALGKLVRESE
ncbi:MAG: AAA family ATPase [Bradymonadales bacterium]|nr:AAA family ATPase [Bradymonadales bacterium]